MTEDYNIKFRFIDSYDIVINFFNSLEIFSIENFYESTCKCNRTVKLDFYIDRSQIIFILENNLYYSNQRSLAKKIN